MKSRSNSSEKLCGAKFDHNVPVEGLANRVLGVLACWRAHVLGVFACLHVCVLTCLRACMRVLCLRASYDMCLACLLLTHSCFCLIIYFVCINQGLTIKRKLLIHVNLS